MKLSMKGMRVVSMLALGISLPAWAGCEGDIGADSTAHAETRDLGLSAFAGGCYAIQESQGRWLTKSPKGDRYTFVSGDVASATPFFMKAADLATYLLFDSEKGYVVSEEGPLMRQTRLRSDSSEQVDRYQSPAEWVLEAAGPGQDQLYHLRNGKTGWMLSAQGVAQKGGEPAKLSLVATSRCAPHPELTVDATGTVKPPTFSDGAVWGIVEPHTHAMANYGFGGGGVVHGSAFHRLGVQHALGDCRATHGAGGARDLFGNVFENKIDPGFVFQSMIPDIISGRPQGLFHETSGYPSFTDWPSAPFSSTHQVQYYKWIERAWMGGLRLMVQHAVSNSVICELSDDLNLQTPRRGCTDMAAVDRSIEETHAMERYIDAQAGGAGKGFFRIVTSAAQARQVIREGKLAVLLGIETSNLFDCMLTPKRGMPVCDEAYVERTLDEYQRRGIRALFPVHKFDNAFSAGDGNRDFIEVGNFLNSGHFSNFVEEGCPDSGAVFDKGPIAFSSFNKPRNEYDAPPPWDPTRLTGNLVATLAPQAPRLLLGGAEGKFCQKHGFTRLGEFLLRQMMKRGMIIEVDHLPQHSYARAFEILTEYDYPPAASHGSQGTSGQVYALGGISKANTGTCRDPNRKGAMLDDLRQRIALKRQKGAYPGEAWSWDLNGFAGAPGPRFGDRSVCGAGQEDPVTYPFRSYAGDVTFTQPRVGNRVLDFNTEGLVHIGLLPEIIDDLRRDASSDAELEPLFRSAEAYLRMWEKAEKRAAVIRGYGDDDCPFDLEKTELGLCGCGVADTDADEDGTPDCMDKCPLDPSKAAPGICSCGTPDIDTDVDGVPDCNDRCPGDPDMIAPGVCGCGAAEVDSDGDGLKDCVDGCPNDASKAAPEVCGCGVTDDDSDGDGTADCADNCPSDAQKTAPGSCGCGVADVDSDSDGAVDCHDLCPSDPDKTAPEECGCGVPEGKCGLLGTYFHNKDLTNEAFKRVDKTIDFDWGRGAPASSMADHHFSVRWTGQVEAPTTGTYTFYTVSDDGVRLWVNNQLIIDQWRDLPREEHRGTIHLEAGKRYAIRLEYYENHFDAVCKLFWSSDATPKQIVPRKNLTAFP